VPRYVGAVFSEAYREFFAATAATAGTLTGLLFVALSVERGDYRAAGAAVIKEVRTAAALLAFSNALVVALFSLVPGTEVGWPSSVLGVSGLLFTAAAIRSILTSGSTRRQQRRQIGLIRTLLLIFGAELIAGIVSLVSPGNTTAPEVIGYALVGSLIVGVGRAWELVGNRDTGITTSLAVLAGREPRSLGDDGAGTAAAAAGPDAGRDAGPGPGPAASGNDDGPPGE
jgi:hypothetical protein